MNELDLWSATVEEARDRLVQSIAEDVDDVVQQLVEEGICFEGDAKQLKNTLENPR